MAGSTTFVIYTDFVKNEALKIAQKRVKNGLFQPSDLQVPNSYQILPKVLPNFYQISA